MFLSYRTMIYFISYSPVLYIYLSPGGRCLCCSEISDKGDRRCSWQGGSHHSPTGLCYIHFISYSPVLYIYLSPGGRCLCCSEISDKGDRRCSWQGGSHHPPTGLYYISISDRTVLYIYHLLQPCIIHLSLPRWTVPMLQ